MTISIIAQRVSVARAVHGPAKAVISATGIDGEEIELVLSDHQVREMLDNLTAFSPSAQSES